MRKTGKQKTTHVIFGVHPLIELLKAKRRRLVMLYTTKPAPKAWKRIEPLLPRGLQIQHVSRDALTKIAGSSDHQGLVGVTTQLPLWTKPFDPEKHSYLVMLDGIQDPRNLGAILRTAYCANVDGVVITQRESAPLNAVVFKASAGLAEHLNIRMVPSAKAGLLELSKLGYTPYLAVLGHGESALEVDYKEPLCVVIGSEQMGISPEIMKEGTAITLPQRRGDISYNASVAAGILLFVIGTTINKLSAKN